MGSALSLWGPPSLRLLGGGAVLHKDMLLGNLRTPGLLGSLHSCLRQRLVLAWDSCWCPPKAGTPPRAGLQVGVHLLLHQPRRGIWDPAAKSSLGAPCEIFRLCSQRKEVRRK